MSEETDAMLIVFSGLNLARVELDLWVRETFHIFETPYATTPRFWALFKPWSNGLASSRKQRQAELAWRFALGGQTDWQVSSQVHASRKKKTHFKADIYCISLVNNKLMDDTQLALTWVGWPNSEKLTLTCVQI